MGLEQYIISVLDEPQVKVKLVEGVSVTDILTKSRKIQ
jgi:hypothetical protein